MKILFYPFLFSIVLMMSHCTHYYLKDQKNFLLSEKQKSQFLKKKFLLLGFHPFHFSLEKRENFESKEPKFPCSYFNTLVEINRDLAVYNCLVEFINSGKEPAHPELYNKIHQRIPATRYNPSYSIPAFISETNSTKIFFPTSQEESIQHTTGQSNQPSEEKIRNFLSLYLSTVRHAGLKEIESIVHIEYAYSADESNCKEGQNVIQKIKRIQFKKSNVDYYILANQKNLYTQSLTNPQSNKTRNLKVLTFLPAIMTLGLIPYWDEALFESKFYIFDKDLNLKQTLVYQDRIEHITALWLLFSKSIHSPLIQYRANHPRDIDLYETSTRKIVSDINTFLLNSSSL